MNVDAGFQLSDLTPIVRRRIKVVVGSALAVSLAAYWVAMALPNEYESYATVLVEPQAVDPDLVEAGVAQTDLNRRLHLMTAQILSRPRLSRIIDELGLFKDEASYLTRDEIISVMRNQIRVAPVVPELQREKRIQDFAIDQFRIYFRDDDPVVARDVAQRLANDFIQEHIASRIRVSQKSVEFIDAELERLAGEIGGIESKISSVKAANPGRLPEDVANTQRRLDRLTAELAAARREAAAARSDEAFFRSQSATARELMGGVHNDDSPQSRIAVLELVLADYESRGFTEKHPDVIKARSELQVLQTQVAEKRANEDAPGSFAEHSADAEAERARNRRGHAEEEVTKIQDELDQVQLLLAQVPQVAELLDALDREYRHLFQSYQDFSQRRLEAGVQADLERRQLGEQFRVLEAAFLVREPTSPDRLVIVVAGIVFGLALGAGVGIVLEVADASVHSVRQLQAGLNIPVLASIPRIWLESDRLRERRKRIRTVAVALTLVAVALVGGAANYWWVNGSGPSFETAAEQGAQEAAGGQPTAAAPAGGQ